MADKMMNTVDLFAELCAGDTKAKTDWYFASWFVENKLPKVTCACIGPRSSESIKVVLEGVDRHTVAIARQIALLAHFPNFDESSRSNATKIYFLVEDEAAADKTLREFPYFKNLYIYSRDPRHSYLDVEIILATTEAELPKDCTARFDWKTIYNAFNTYDDGSVRKQEMDIRLAKRMNMIYCLGGDLNNLSSDNTNDVQRYAPALRRLSCHCDAVREQAEWDSIGDVRLKLSNCFCSSVFYLRLYGAFADVLKKERPENPLEVKEKMNQLLKNEHHAGIVTRYIENNIRQLSCSEHARWNVEKLILGYRPFTAEERYTIDQLFAEEKKNYHKRKKNAPEYAHEDICSYRDLARIRPEDMKYDSFMLLAIPQLLKEQL